MSNYIYGIHAVQSVLENHPENVKALFVLSGKLNHRLQKVVDVARRAGVSVNLVPGKTLLTMSKQPKHQGVVAEVVGRQLKPTKDLLSFVAELSEPAFLLVLDGVQDPHNLGACLRSADAAGVHAVIVPKDKAVGLTPTVRNVACGAAETVPFFQVTNLARTLEQLKEAGVWLVGAAGEAEQSIYQADFVGPTAIVLGAEGDGLRRLTRDKCDYLYKIPMVGSVESLNVSVSAGIFLFEVVRQRLSSS